MSGRSSRRASGVKTDVRLRQKASPWQLSFKPCLDKFGGPPGTRTRDHRIKSPLVSLLTTTSYNTQPFATTRIECTYERPGSPRCVVSCCRELASVEFKCTRSAPWKALVTRSRTLLAALGSAGCRGGGVLVGVMAEVADGEPTWNRQKRAELIDRCVRFVHHGVNKSQIQHTIRAIQGVPGNWEQ